METIGFLFKLASNSQKDNVFLTPSKYSIDAYGLINGYDNKVHGIL